MSALREIQAAMLHDIYSGERTSARFLDPDQPDLQDRLDIYENNTLQGLSDVLANIYPVVQRIVGEGFFRQMARAYIRQNPQSVGNRNGFGHALARFTVELGATSSLPYLDDVAEIEWAFFQASIAQDAKRLSLSDLQELLQHDEALVLTLHPSVHILNLRYNALEIWQAHQAPEVNPIHLIERLHTLVAWRDDNDDVLFREISPAMRILLQESQAGQGFSLALERSQTETGDTAAFQQEFAEIIASGIVAKSKEGE